MLVQSKIAFVSIYFLSVVMMLIPLDQLFSDDIFTISDAEEILSEVKELRGEIQNVKLAPFDSNIFSFELKNKKKSKIYLFNKSTRHLIELKSIEYAYGQKRKSRYLIKEFDVEWHPTLNLFTYVSNAYKNRNKMFICKITNSSLATKYSIKGSMLKLDEDKEEKSKCKSPSFDITGNDLVFSRRTLNDKKSMYDICLITDFNEIIKSGSYENISFEIVVNENFNQINPKYSPSFTDRLVAYTSFTNKKSKKQKNYIAEYEIRVLDLDTRITYLVDELEGFKSYSLIWSDNGKTILYSMPKSRLLVKPELLKKKQDQITLRIAEVRKVADKLFIMPISNNKGYSVILDDIIGKDNSFVFYDKKIAFVTKYNNDNSTSIYIVNLDKWRNAEKDFFQEIELRNDMLNPLLNNDKDRIIFIDYNYNNDKYIISNLKIKIIETNMEENTIQKDHESIEIPNIDPNNGNDTKLKEIVTEDEEETFLADEEVILEDENLNISDDKKTEKIIKKSFEIKTFKIDVLEVFKKKDSYLLSEIIEILQTDYNYKNIDINKNLFFTFRDLSIDKRNEADKVVYFKNGKTLKTNEINGDQDSKKSVENNDSNEDEYSDDEDDEDDFFEDENDDTKDTGKDKNKRTKRD